MTVTKDISGTWYLQTMLYKKLLENFEPNLFFTKLWEKPMIDNWIGTISWARASKLSASAAASTLAEWVTPSTTAFNYTTISTTPVQYWLYVTVSDRLIKAAPTAILSDASKEIWANMARLIDQVVQTEVISWTNELIVWGWARADIGSWDVITASAIRQAVVSLRAKDAPTIDGTYFMAVAHPFVIWDLTAETNWAWIEFSKYTTPDKLFKWEIWALYGCRFSESSNVQTIASTVTVYPTMVLWKWAYWVANWASLENIYKPLWSGWTEDPLKQRATVWAKVDFAAKILQEDAMIRIESAATAV